VVFIAKLLVLALTAAATPILRRDAVTVEDDISQKIGPQIQTLDTDVNGFPASGLSGVLAIHNDFQNLVTIVNGATSDIESAGSFSETEGTTILPDVQDLTPTLLDILSYITSQVDAWQDIPGGYALVLNDL
jgi:hypothetical protein